MNLPKSRYDQTKVNDTPRILEPMAVQDVFSVLSIDESGVFELMIDMDAAAEKIISIDKYKAV